MGPVKSFLDRDNELSRVNWKSEGGIVPVRALAWRLSFLRNVNFESEGGIVPDSIPPLNVKSVSRVNWEIDDGMLPMTAASSIEIEVNCVRRPISLGIVCQEMLSKTVIATLSVVRQTFTIGCPINLQAISSDVKPEVGTDVGFNVNCCQVDVVDVGG